MTTILSEVESRVKSRQQSLTDEIENTARAQTLPQKLLKLEADSISISSHVSHYSEPVGRVTFRISFRHYSDEDTEKAHATLVKLMKMGFEFGKVAHRWGEEFERTGAKIFKCGHVTATVLGMPMPMGCRVETRSEMTETTVVICEDSGEEL